MLERTLTQLQEVGDRTLQARILCLRRGVDKITADNLLRAALLLSDVAGEALVVGFALNYDDIIGDGEPAAVLCQRMNDMLDAYERPEFPKDNHYRKMIADGLLQVQERAPDKYDAYRTRAAKLDIVFETDDANDWQI